ncbi:hypothetical protein [Novipirellula rosea]|uniref:hypothetical protein n=1 Tax=Novipirellula rosea TaxID=1031540 RepID=UPI0031E69A7A
MTFTQIRNWPAIHVRMSPEHGWPAKSLPNESEMRTTPRHKGAGIRNPTLQTQSGFVVAEFVT